MADVKISGLPATTTINKAAAVIPLVDGGATKKISVEDLCKYANEVAYYNFPVHSLNILEGTWTQKIMVRNSAMSGNSFETGAILGTVNGTTVQHFINFSIPANKVVDFYAEFCLYNVDAITDTTYTAQVELYGIESANAMVKLGTTSNVTLYKSPYAVTKVPFSYTGTVGASSLEGLIVKVTLAHTKSNAALIGGVIGKLKIPL